MNKLITKSLKNNNNKATAKAVVENVNLFSDIFKKVWLRTKPITPVEWAERNRYLDSSVSSISGKVSYRHSPYLIEIVNNFDSRSPVREFALMKGVQLGASQLIFETAIGYIIAVDPSSILYLTADEELAKENMETRIDPMINSSGLVDKIRAFNKFSKVKRSGNTATRKEFAGGVLRVFGANSANKLRNFSVKVLMFDEVDGVKKNVGRQGSPTALAKARTTSFESTRKIAYISTPLSSEESNINPLFLAGDQRFWHVPCPFCGEEQVLKWSYKKKYLDDIDDLIYNDKVDAGIKFELDQEGNLIDESVHYQCINGCKIEEKHKYAMNLNGRWIPTKKSSRTNYRSYHLSSLPSNFSTWAGIVGEFLEAKKNQDKLQVWVNNRLGEVFYIKPKTLNPDRLNKNVMNYNAGLVPNKLALEHGNGNIAVLIAAVDVNGSNERPNGWLAVEVKGFCSNGSNYSIAKAEIHGNLSEGGSCWLALEKIMNSVFYSDNEIEYKIGSCFVDSGARTKDVYWFVNKSNRYFAVKGVSSSAAYKVKKQKQDRAMAFNVNVNKYKDELIAFLMQETSTLEQQPSFFYNFPKDEEKTGFEALGLEATGVTLAGGGYNKRYFSTFASETKEVKTDANTGEITSIGDWKKVAGGGYNHFWDCNVYAMAGVDITCQIIAENFGVKEVVTTSILRTMELYLNKYNKPYIGRV